jgi:hypothetical protein
MATIKLQGGKVLLKDGKVSCSCCEPCCMYPADGLGDTYEAADLPATLYGKWADRADGTFTKSGDEYTLGTVTIRVNAGGTAWEFHDSDDDATSTIGNCLIRGDGNYTPEDDAVEDQFEDTYAVGNTGVTVTRVSLCDWISEDQAHLYFSPNDQRWEVNVFEQGIGQPDDSDDDSESWGIYTKDGTQDSPVGGYSKAGYTLTVS